MQGNQIDLLYTREVNLGARSNFQFRDLYKKNVLIKNVKEIFLKQKLEKI